MAKKEEEKELPVDDIISFSRQGYNDAEIIQYLREEGYSIKEVNDAMNQAKIKMDIGRGDEEGQDYQEQEQEQQYQVPEPAEQEQGEEQATDTGAGYDYSQQQGSTEELVEEIVNEKWQEFKKKIGDMPEFKKTMDLKLNNLNDRVKRLELAMEKTQAAVIDKVQESSQNIKALGAEIAALETAFSKILEPLSANVKELSSLKKIIPVKSAVSADETIKALHAMKSKVVKKKK